VNRPVVASYCTTFLKKEMRHIYRQVSGLHRYQTFIMTRERLNEESYPFDDIEILPRPRGNFLRRFYLKYIQGEEPLLYRGEFQQLMGLIERRQPDLIHVYFGHTGAHLVTLIERWSGPVVVSFHGMDVMHREDRRYMRDLRRLFAAARIIMARSESLGRRLVELGCPHDKIRLNRTSVPTDAFPYMERPTSTDKEWILVQTSRLIPKKGLQDSLHAFAAFSEKHPSSKFILAGEGPLRDELEELAQRLGIRDKVEFTGFLSQEELREIYSKSHLFLHPSRTTEAKDQEGVPNAMLEAMATGLPVVATRHGGIPEAVPDGEAGILVPERSPDQLAAAIEKVLSDRETWHRFSEQAAETVRERFSPEASIAALESCYDEALGHRPTS